MTDHKLNHLLNIGSHYDFDTGFIDGCELSVRELQRIEQCVNALSGIEDVEGFMADIKIKLEYIYQHVWARMNQYDVERVDKQIQEALALFPQPKEPRDDFDLEDHILSDNRDGSQ